LNACPYCKAPVKYPSKPGRWPGQSTPTTYECGTVTSKEWSPPLRYCKDKKTFKIRTVSGGVYRQAFYHDAVDLAALCAEIGMKLVEERPNWAFAHCSATMSAEITW
jgi:hypothetical protein